MEGIAGDDQGLQRLSQAVNAAGAAGVSGKAALRRSCKARCFQAAEGNGPIGTGGGWSWAQARNQKIRHIDMNEPTARSPRRWPSIRLDQWGWRNPSLGRGHGKIPVGGQQQIESPLFFPFCYEKYIYHTLVVTLQKRQPPGVKERTFVAEAHLQIIPAPGTGGARGFVAAVDASEQDGPFIPPAKTGRIVCMPRVTARRMADVLPTDANLQHRAAQPCAKALPENRQHFIVFVPQFTDAGNFT